MSLSLTLGEFGGMGMRPHVPLPPFATLDINFASASPCSRYLAATSFHAGPTSFFSIVWQVKQPLFCASSRSLVVANVIPSLDSGFVSTEGAGG